VLRGEGFRRADLVQRPERDSTIAVSTKMIAERPNNSWSELLTSALRGRKKSKIEIRTQPSGHENRLISGLSNAAQYCRDGASRMVTILSEETHMLWTIFVVLLILWLLGFSLHIAGGLIHLLLVVALVVLVINLVSGRSAV
jgi:hypothetical protein